MSNKKRNKKYRGRNAVPDKPVVKRYKAESKSKFQIWLEDNKQNLKIRGIITGVIAVLIVIIVSIIQLIF